jgi:hypothetical protein
MTILWTIALLVGGLLGVTFDRLYRRYERWRAATEMKEKYGRLARRYQVLRDGITVTGGSIELVQNNDGTFRSIARNSDDTIQWEGQLQMTDTENVWTGSYRYPLSTDHGTQIAMYVPELDLLHVVGQNQSTTAHAQFVHDWVPHIHQDHILT